MLRFNEEALRNCRKLLLGLHQRKDRSDPLRGVREVRGQCYVPEKKR